MVRTLSNRDRPTDLFSLHRGQFNFGNVLLETSYVWDPGTGLRIRRKKERRTDGIGGAGGEQGG